jgi:NDP-sugar pyrophosphorylase family protein
MQERKLLQNPNQSKLFAVAVLAGGLATRLRPVTETIPKALIEIKEEPFIFHQLRLLKKNGIHKVVLCVGYLGEQIEAIVGTGKDFGLTVEYAYDSQNGGPLLGTAGAIKRALPLLGENFFVTYGDSYLTCSYSDVQHSFEAQKKLSLMTVFHNQGQWDKSNVKYVNNEIIIYDKKSSDPDLHYIDYGLGVFHASAFDKVPENVFYDLADLYKMLLAEKQLGAFEVKERFYEIGSFSGIEEMNQLELV